MQNSKNDTHRIQMMNKPTLVFVHGAFSTTTAFNYFKRELSDYPQLSFAYDWNVRTTHLGRQLAEFVTDNVTTPNVILLGHSLGGNVSLHSLQHFPKDRKSPKVLKVFTYGSPLGGSVHATLMGLVLRTPVLKHVGIRSSEIKALKNIHIDRALVHSFVTTRGPISNHNDGVVTVASQTAIEGLQYTSVDINHTEVLLSDEVIAQTRFIIES